MTQQWTPATFKEFYREEHDACGIVSCIEKKKIPTNENIFACIDALVKMNHRCGFINGEGDGAGIHIDIPRALWKKKLEAANIDSGIVDQDTFIVGHLFLSKKTEANDLKIEVKEKLLQHGLSLIFETDKAYRSEALGPIAIQEDPVFWQFACSSTIENNQELSNVLFELTSDIEKSDFIHVASLSQHHAVYKVMGAGDTLPAYYLILPTL